MSRLYFTAPDVHSAKQVVDELLLNRIDEAHIHVLAKAGIPLEDLPEASFLMKSDFASAVEKGVALGSTAGIIAGLVALAIPGGLILGGGATLLATTVAGASVGAFGASLKAVDVPNTRFKEFEAEVDEGRILIIVDVPSEKVDTTRTAVTVRHSEVRDKGQESSVPTFP